MTTPVSNPPGLCDPWTPHTNWDCTLPLNSGPVTGAALQMASEVLWAMTARRFSLCEMTIRPCRRDCYGAIPFGWNEYGGSWGYPYPALIRGLWFNLGCGGCTEGCSCAIVSEVALPGPVFEVTRVKVDGVILTKNVDYRLDDWRLLVRLNAQWPICNNLNLADTQPGTWSVTFTTGEQVPPLGNAAVGVLAAEFVKLLLCDASCALPKPVQSLVRQGVTMTFLDPNELFANGRIGLYLPDLFISTYNPNSLTRRSKVYDIDARQNSRQLGTD